MYTSEVKSLHACNIFAAVDILRYIHKRISIPVLLSLKTTLMYTRKEKSSKIYLLEIFGVKRLNGH